MAGGFKLHEFISATSDFSRGYTFYVLFLNGPVSLEQTKFLVRGARLPASTIESATTSWQGNAYKVGTTQTFEPFSVTFNVDVKDNIRNEFLLWAESVHNASSNIHGKPDDYMNDIMVQHISHLDTKTITEYRLVKAWPTSVGALELAYESKEIAQFEVSFEYQYHTSGGTSAPPGGGDDQHTA